MFLACLLICTGDIADIKKLHKLTDQLRASQLASYYHVNVRTYIYGAWSDCPDTQNKCKIKVPEAECLLNWNQKNCSEKCPEKLKDSYLLN